MVACFLACMKAGHPYVPLDRFSVPAERVASIAGQVRDASGSQPTMLAVEPLPGSVEAPARAIGREELDALAAAGGSCDPAAAIAGEDLAYILFTSGSTGAPKGVEVTASCLDNFCDWDRSLAQGAAAPGSVWIDQAPFSFDLSVFELVGALSTGGTLFSLAHGTQASPAALMGAFGGSGAAVWVSTPSFAEVCLANEGFDASLLPRLSLFLFCGETLPNAVASRLLDRFPAAHVVNTYGPTESTVAVTQVEVGRKLAASPEPLPVGAPRPGTRLRIVRPDGSDAPVGARGEVVIEGDTVALGYYGRPDLTAAAFGTAELEGRTVRSYRTGDEGYLGQAGMLHYHGRIDLQVKLNGYRIELGDVEEHLRALPSVSAAAVVPATRGGRVDHLVAYVVAPGRFADSDFRAGMALKEQLKGTLPHYMIPRKIAFVDALPMTGNGKIDRRLLAARSAR